MSDIIDNINKFWEYVADNLPKLDLLELLKTYNNGTMNESRGYFDEIIRLGNAIHSNLYVNVRDDTVYLSENIAKLITDKIDFNIMPMMKRNLFILTSNGDVSAFAAIDKTYELSPALPNNWVVMKYEPCGLVTPTYLVFKNRRITPDKLQFTYNLLTDTDIDLIFVMDDELTKEIITSQQDIYDLRSAFLNYLECLFGEYNTYKYIIKFTVIPESYINRLPKSDLKPFLSFFKVIWDLLPMNELCGACKTPGLNIAIRDGLCKYCDGFMKKLLE